MSAQQSSFYFPKDSQNPEGNTRRVGYELEFAGLDLPQVSDIVAKTLGGKHEPETQAESRVSVPELGEFVIELDWALGKKVARERAAEKEEGGEHFDDDKLMEWAMRAARELVPVEIVCPPIAIDQLHHLNKMIEPLRKAGALGTDQSLLYAFGVHLNPEIPDFEPTTLLAWLQSFGIAQEWLIKAHEVDVARRITPYIDVWPKQYVKELLQLQPEEVTQDQLIEHYLKFNPTRNRALDMLPLFRHLNEELVMETIKDGKVNARPTFHYRLPNCEIDEEGWSLAESWNVWCVVETLAGEPETRRALAEQWLEYDNNLINLSSPPWHEELTLIRKNLSSV